MKKQFINIYGVLSLVLILSVSIFSQNTFDGTKVIVDAPAGGGMSAVRYLSGDVFVETDYTTSLTACSGQPAPMDLDPGSTTTKTWKITRNTSTGYWCFKSPNSEHEVSWEDPAVTTNKWLPNTKTTGFQNVKDFGAEGDGTTDDTVSIKNALLYLSSKGGGTLNFSRGTYKVTDTITLPSGVLLQGTTGRGTATFTNPGATRIRLETASKALFRIGEDTDNVRMKNIELTSTSTTNTYGVEGVGKFNANGLGSTQIMSFDNVIFSKFDIGIYAHVATGGADWQFDYIKIESCSFAYNKTAGIKSEVANSDWNIISSIFYLPKKETGVEADGIHIFRALAVLVQNSFGGGDGPSNRGGDFIEAQSLAVLQVINSECESTTHSLFWGDHPDAGNLASTVTFIGNLFVDPIDFEKRVNFISSGNSYGGDTITANDSRVMIYSTGDRFCEDSFFLGAAGSVDCGSTGTANIGFQGIGKIMYQTGQLKDGVISAIPTKIGTDVEIEGDSANDPNKPILKVTVPNVAGQGKTFIEMGQSPFMYTIGRDQQTGFLTFKGTQGAPWQGYIFDAPLRLPTMTLAQIGGNPFSGQGALIYCSNCNTSSTPCTAGGSGALAVYTGTQWSCK